MEDLRPRTTLFCAVLAFAIALSMLLRGRRAVHWLFAGFATDVAFWYGSQSLAYLAKEAIWDRVTAVLTVLLPQFAVHLFQAVVPLEGESAPRSRLPRVAMVCGLVMLVLQLSPYHDTPLALGAAYFYVFGFLAAALVSLARRGQKSSSRAVRDRVRFLVVVGALATTFTLADFLSFLGGAVRHLPPVGAVLATVFLFVLAESLTRPRLADLYDMAGRLLVSTALAFCLAGIYYVFVEYVGRFNTYLNAVLAAIVFLVLFEPLQSEVEKRIHQFFRERYDLETSVTALRRELAHVLEIDEMVKTVLGGLERSRRATSVAIYLRDPDGDGFDLVGSVGATAPRRVEALAIRPLIELLGGRHSVYLEEVAHENKEENLPLITAAQPLGPLKDSVLLIVRGDDNDLVGLICVADDRVRDAFTPEEIVLLETLGAQIGVAIANSRVYSRMKERDRLAALGAMAAGLAHEVKNPLGAIKGAAQLLEEIDGASSATDSNTREFVGIILEEVNRLDRVVGSFLAYARPHAGNPIPLDINAAVKRTIQILRSQHDYQESVAKGGESVDFKTELAQLLPRAKIDPEQFRQVLMNLVQNAVQAMDGHGRVTVSTTRRTVSRAVWNTAPSSDRSGIPAPQQETEFVEVSVRDTGPGISQKVLKNLFVPFFTTKEQGTGLGLAISQSIVQNAGGNIEVQSHAGAGTTFTIVLPGAGYYLQTPAPTDSMRPPSIVPPKTA